MVYLCDVFSGCLEFYSCYCFGNYIGGMWADYMYVKNFIGFFVGQDFYYVFGVGVCLCLFQCFEWEFVGFVGDVCFFELFFSLFNVCYFWLGIDYIWDEVVVDVWFFIGNDFGDEYVFFFSFVGKYGFVDDIINGVDVVYVGFQVGIYFDMAMIVGLDIYVFEFQFVGISMVANSYQVVVCVDGEGFFSILFFYCYGYVFFVDFDVVYFMFEVEFYVDFFQCVYQFFVVVFVYSGQDVVYEFYDFYFSVQVGKNRVQFQFDDVIVYEYYVFRYFIDIEGFGRGNDLFFVIVESGWYDGFGVCCDDDFV